MKNSYYFSHDNNSFMDPKIRIVVNEFGVWTYAMFWIIIEMLSQQRDYKVEKRFLADSLFPLLQGKNINSRSEGGIVTFHDDTGSIIDEQEIGCFSICLAKIKDVLSMMIEIGLFAIDDKYIWSNSLIERMDKRAEISEKRKIAGRSGGLAKASNSLANDSSKVNKERKGKEIKGNINIYDITENQLQQIAEKYSVPLAFVKSKYDDMVNWHESTGKKKKDWIATLRNFVKKDAISIRKEQDAKSRLAVITE